MPINGALLQRRNAIAQRGARPEGKGYFFSGSGAGLSAWLRR
jgi:hypothetical protein